MTENLPNDSITEKGGANPLPQAPRFQPNEMLSVARAATEYGVGKTMIWEALGQHELPAKVLGKRGTRIRRTDMDRWIESLPDYKPKKPRPS